MILQNCSYKKGMEVRRCSDDRRCVLGVTRYSTGGKLCTMAPSCLASPSHTFAVYRCFCLSLTFFCKNGFFSKFFVYMVQVLVNSALSLSFCSPLNYVSFYTENISKSRPHFTEECTFHEDKKLKISEVKNVIRGSVKNL